MTVSLFTPNRTVFLITDEALCIYAVSSKGVRLIETVPWDVENFEGNVARIVSKDCGKRPILILNDMVEQHYRKEKVVSKGVSVLDRSNILKRKLGIAFPNYPVRAALPLKEKITGAEGKVGADIFIFAAVPGSNQFVQSMGAAKRSMASIVAFCLLPIESSDLVKTLSAKLSKNKKTKSRWSIFIGQHKNGSLRQIVTKDGELALTRMTPIAESDENIDLWAGDVHQEFKATMSYLSRFGYQAEDGLDVIVMANPATGEFLETLIEEECNYYSLTVSEASRLLNLPASIQEDDRYADSLHVAWSARKNKFILPMKATQLDEVSKPRRVATMASMLLFFAAAFLGYQLLDQYQSLTEILDDLDDARHRYAQLDVQYKKEVQRKEELGFDVRLVQGSIAVFERLEKERIKPLHLFKGIGHALGKDLRIDEIDVERPSAILSGDIGLGGDTAPLYEARMQMTYPRTTDIDRGNKEVRDLRGRLQSMLQGYEVEVTKYLKDYEYVEEIVVESGDLDKKDVQQDFIAEITIKRLAIND